MQASAAGGEALARLASARAVLQKRATRLDQQCAPRMCSLVSSVPFGMASGDKPYHAVHLWHSKFIIASVLVKAWLLSWVAYPREYAWAVNTVQHGRKYLACWDPESFGDGHCAGWNTWGAR